jgi:hypothetical protein
MKIRKEYESIFKEIEENNADVEVVWPAGNRLCYPKFEAIKDNGRVAAQTQGADKTEQLNLSKDDTTIISTNLNKDLFNDLQHNQDVIDDDEKSHTKPNLLTATVGNTDTNMRKPSPLSFEDDETLRYLKHENISKLNKSSLNDLKETVSLEILWIQQAIQSRVQVIFPSNISISVIAH